MKSGWNSNMWNFIKNIFSKQEAVEIQVDPMKYLIVGLGNIGSKYEGTRHNIGFDVLDAIAEDKGETFKNDTLADLCTVKHKGRTLILVKPTTYMNLSGKALRYWMTKHKILPENVLVVVDDLNLDFNVIRMRSKGKDGGHNGLKNINEVLGHQNYARLRMGIGNSFRKGRQVDFVLGKWDDKELADLGSFLDRARKCVLDYTTMGIARAMSANNGK